MDKLTNSLEKSDNCRAGTEYVGYIANADDVIYRKCYFPSVRTDS